MTFIDQNRNKWSIKTLCRVIDVSEGGYHKHCKHANAVPEAPEPATLLAQIHEILKEDTENANYGVQRIYLALRLKMGYTGSLSTIYRICRENNLMIRVKKKANG